MQLTVPPDLETLINKRLSSGGYTNAEDVLRRALEAKMRRRVGPSKSARHCPLTSKTAIFRRSAGNLSRVIEPARKLNR